MKFSRAFVFFTMAVVLAAICERCSEGRKAQRTNQINSSKSRNRAVRWWNLARTPILLPDSPLHPSTPLYISPSLQPLTRKQKRLVSKNPGTLVAVAKGAMKAVQECQYQFRSRRWNCPIEEENHGGPLFGKLLKKGCRETAFVYAITSAALSHAVAQGCSDGSIYTCSCGAKDKVARHSDSTPPSTSAVSEWKWGGCSDNTQFGHKFSREFIDGAQRERDLRNIMNRHNNEAGRLNVVSGVDRHCKCHGMSGSCSLRTCWMRLPLFRQVGDLLKDKYEGAAKVLHNNIGFKRGKTRRSLLPVNPNHKPPELNDLVYFENSPAFCDVDPSISFKGTVGRECNASSISVDGCDLMCCGRGSREETYKSRERCNCVFHWCCRVTCDVCIRTRTRHVCT